MFAVPSPTAQTYLGAELDHGGGGTVVGTPVAYTKSGAFPSVVGVAIVVRVGIVAVAGPGVAFLVHVGEAVHSNGYRFGAIEVV